MILMFKFKSQYTELIYYCKHKVINHKWLFINPLTSPNHCDELRKSPYHARYEQQTQYITSNTIYITVTFWLSNKL